MSLAILSALELARLKWQLEMEWQQRLTCHLVLSLSHVTGNRFCSRAGQADKQEAVMGAPNRMVVRRGVAAEI